MTDWVTEMSTFSLKIDVDFYLNCGRFLILFNPVRKTEFEILTEGLKWHRLIFLFIMASLVLVAGNSLYHLAVEVFMLETRTGRSQFNIYAIVTKLSYSKIAKCL